ncbi:MAG TPA: S1C family serine protease [Acidimicrobiales bacterium]|nr:S1C family serine protease [Acidimicrobiales bacterium]
MAFAAELETAHAKVAETAGASVVRIGRGPGRGAGIVVGEGQVLTNAHNLRGAEVTVTFADGRSTKGTVSAEDHDGDLAVVAVDTEGVPALAWSERDVVLGSPVFAVTVPAGSGPRVTFGTVSGAGRAFRGPGGRLIGGGIEHTAPLARGSSGGPIVDAEGRLLGVNTHRLGEGFYLAVPADAELRRRVDALAKGEAPRRRYLGVALAPARAARRLRASVGLPEADGLLVTGVDEDSPAGRAGVRRGDLIVAAGGHDVRQADDLFAALDGLADDAPLALRLLRGADEVQLHVSFGDGGTEGSA